MSGIGSVYVDIPMAASLLLEGLKYVVRRWVVQDMAYEFDMRVYSVLLPLAQLIVAPILVSAGLLDMLPDYINFSSFGAAFGTVLQVLVQALASVFWYGTVISPLKQEFKFRKLRNEIQEITNEVPSDQLEDIFNAQDE